MTTIEIQENTMTTAWRKSSYSMSNGDCAEWRTSTHSHTTECAEICLGPAVQVRDSKDRDGPVLTFTAAEWAAFTTAIKDTPQCPSAM